MVQSRNRVTVAPRRGHIPNKARNTGYCSLPVILLFALLVVAGMTFISIIPSLESQTDVNQKVTQPVTTTSAPLAPKVVVSPSTAIKGSEAATKPPVKTKPEKSPAKVLPGRSKLGPAVKGSKTVDYHFVHIPKCGGTSMTSILRQIACNLDPQRNADCCTNPGFCDWHARRRCNAIKGCINHFPQSKWIYKEQPSITIMREPVSRAISAFFYRGHSPNLDFFQVRPEFKLIKEHKAPRVEFPEYITMVEYQNIQTRMLGADSFPYRNVPITDEVFAKAKDALQHFFFVGLQEAYDLSVELLQRELGIKQKVEVKAERQNEQNRAVRAQKDRIRKNAALMEQARVANLYDVKLYAMAVQRFCLALAKYPDLQAQLDTSKVKCP